MDGYITAILSTKPKMTTTWGLAMNPEASFRWDKDPVIRLFGFIPVGIKSVLTKIMDDQIKTQVNSISGQLEGSELREKATKMWESSFKPIQLSKPQDIWLRLSMEQANFSGINISNNIMTASVGVKASTEVFVGGEPAPLQVTPLPVLGLEKPSSSGFKISLPVAISYEKMSELLNIALKKDQKWPPSADHPDLLITVLNAVAYPSRDAVVVRIDLVTDFPSRITDFPKNLFNSRGTVFLSGIPVVDNDKK